MLQALRTRLQQAIKAFTRGAWSRVLDLNAAHELPEWANLSQYAQQADIYAVSSWVYIAVSKIAQACGLADLEVYRLDGEEKTEVPNHAIELLLHKPNRWQSQVELLENTFGFLMLTGNAYWFLSGAGVLPDQVMVLRPDRMRIAAGKDTDNLVAGYIYDVDGQQVPLDPAEVIHFKLFNPKSDYYGLSPLEAAALATTNDLSMQRWNRNFFGKRNAVPSGLVNIKRPMTQDQYEQLKRDWLESVGGENRATMFLRGEDISWQDVARTQRDMEFTVGRKFSRDEIFQVYGIPSGMMDANSTEANAKTARDTFLNDTIWPAMVRFTAKLTAELAPFWGEGLIVEADDVRPKDRALDNAELTARSQYMSVNEIRTTYLNLDRYEADPEADVPLALRAKVPSPLELATMGGGSRPGDNPPPDQPPPKQGKQDQRQQDQQAQDDSADEPSVKSVVHTRACERELEQFARYASKGKDIDQFSFQATPLAVQMATKALVDCGQLALLSAKATTPGTNEPRNRLKHQKRIYQGYLTWFDGLKNTRLPKGIRHVNSPSTGKALPDVKRFLSYFDDTYWSGNELDILTSIMNPLIHDAVESGALDTADALHMSAGLGFDSSVFNTFAADYAANYTDATSAKIVGTTQDGFGAILQRYIAQGDATINDLISAVQESRLFSKDRADIISRTEATRAYGLGNFFGGQELAGIAGVDVAIGQAAFEMLMPAHPNCRCGADSEFIYDDSNNLTALDYRWFTVNDELTCVVCGPRNGKLFSEIRDEGL